MWSGCGGFPWNSFPEMMSNRFRERCFYLFRFLRLRISGLIRPIWPGLAILLATMLIAGFVAEFTFTSGEAAFGYTFFRFLRLTLNLSIPLLLLPALCAWVQYYLNWGPGRLIRIKADEQDESFSPFRAWAVRPLQGIGLLMLMATHFSLPLARYLGGILTGAGVPSALPPGELTMGRFLNVGVTSLLLGFVWTMEDLGIRHFNRKTVEIRRVGKYLGSILPILTGFYGVYSLFKDEPTSLAIFSLAQRVIIFYPSLVIFNALHGQYVRRQKERLLKNLKVQPADLQIDTPGL